MKKLLLLFALVFAMSVLWAQAPQKITYQAVVRNAGNTLVTNQGVSVQITILQGSENGSPVYVETHSTTTNVNGLMTIEVGAGTPVSGIFADINWANGPFFMKSEIDPDGGDNYSITGVQELLSVPYALYAGQAANAFSGDYNDLNNKPEIPTVPTNVSSFTNDAGYITAVDIPEIPTVPTNVSAFTNDAGYITGYTEQQVLTISNDTIFLTGNSFVKLPTGFDGDYNSLTNKPELFSGDYNDLSNKPEIPTVPTNVSSFANDAGYITSADIPEIQTVPTNVSSFTNDAGYITSMDIPEIPVVPTDVSAFNNDAGYITGYTEQQVLTISNDTIFLTGNSFVKLPAGFDGDYNSLTNKPELFSGDYNDLENLPQIPQIPADVSTFNNDAGYITSADIPEIPIVPTDVSAFNNDAGYITMDSIPEIHTVPTNVSAFANDAGYITMDSVMSKLAGSQTGDIMYWDATSGTWIMMPAGNTGQVLTMDNGVPKWATLPDYTTMILPPTVITLAPSEVTQSSALCGGEITSDGNVQLTACGICWSTQHFPTIANSHTEDDLNVSAFTSHIAGLAHHTTYYVRAYATNTVGTTYGTEVSFTTEEIPSDSLTMPAPCSADTNTTWHPSLGPGSILCAGTDSVDLTLNNYQYGSIQWQYSLDTVSWFNISGAIEPQLTYKPEQTQFVRAEVSYANCPTEYSEVKLLQKIPIAYAGVSRTVSMGDTLHLQANTEDGSTGNWQIMQGSNGFLSTPTDADSKFYGTDTLYRMRWTLTNNCGSSSDDINVRYVQTTVSSKVVVVDTTDIIFSDSTQMANGFYKISFSDPNIVIGDSTILVSIINGGFLRRVDSWEMSDDTTYAMYTTQATLYDILESGVFQFDAISGVNEVENTEESETSTQNVLFLNHLPTREELRSNSDMTRSGTVYVLQVDIEREDGSRVSLMPRQASSDGAHFSASNETKFNKVKWNEAQIYPSLGIKFENVNFCLDAKPTMEYDGDRRRLRFGLYNAHFKMSVDLVPYLTLTLFDYTPVDWDIIKGSVKFFVPISGVPVPFTLDYGVKFNMSGSLNISDTARYRLTSSATITRGVRYYVKSNKYELDTVTRGNTNIELVSEKLVGSVDVSTSISAYLNLKLLTLAGPRIQFGYKAKIKYCQSFSGNNGWQGKITSNLFTMLDLKGAKIIDPIIPENWSKEWTYLKHERVFPFGMHRYGGNSQTIHASGPLPSPIKVVVKGSGDKPIRNVPVYFVPDDGTVSDSLAFTDQNGIAQTFWTPSEPNGNDHQLFAYAYDCQQHQLINSPLMFSAYESDDCAHSTLDLHYYVSGNNVSFVASGGMPPYTYSDGADPVSNAPVLPASGTYIITVKDAYGCSYSITYGNDATILCDWSDLELDAEISGETLTLYATGGTPPYLYSIEGATCTQAYSQNNVFSLLSPGSYITYVQDNAGCTFSRTIIIEDDASSSTSASTTDHDHSCAGAATVTDYDGNVYHTMQIGQQCWMKENLRATHYADGTIIPIGAGCYYPNGNADNKSRYGLLYTWFTATRNVSSGSNPSGVQGVCPYGWHVPSDAEWQQLLNQPQLMVCSAKALATKFGWNTSTTPCSPGYEFWYNNGSEFNAAPAGQYHNGYGDFGSVAFFWSSTEQVMEYWNCAWFYRLKFDESNVYRTTYFNSYEDYTKYRSFSVRCLRD